MHATTVLAILVMAAVTYLTRVLGYLGLRNRNLSPRALAVMEAVPGCVLISVIAPNFAFGSPFDLLVLAIIIVAATRFSMLPTVLIGMAAAWLLRHHWG